LSRDETEPFPPISGLISNRKINQKLKTLSEYQQGLKTREKPGFSVFWGLLPGCNSNFKGCWCLEGWRKYSQRVIRLFFQGNPGTLVNFEGLSAAARNAKLLLWCIFGGGRERRPPNNMAAAAAGSPAPPRRRKVGAGEGAASPNQLDTLAATLL